MSEEFPWVAAQCKRGECNHQVCPRRRSYRCEAGLCGCASKDLACGTSGVDRPALEGTGPVLPFPIGPVTPEVQPPAATATEATAMDKDTPTPDHYVTRIDRPAPHREEGSFMMHYGTHARSRLLTSVGNAAMHQAAVTRVEHRYWGPMTVWVWEHRGDAEGYREAPPATAYRRDLPDTTVGPSKAAQAMASAMTQTEMVARLVAPPGREDEAAAIVHGQMTSRAHRYRDDQS